MGRVFWSLIGAALLVLPAYTPQEMQPRQAQASPEPSSAKEKRKLCQPFPDRLIDEFVNAYNDRDEETLQQLVTDRWIDDTVASGYSSVATFEDVRQWAHAGWNVDDVLDLVGYGAFHPTKWGFQMYLTRRSDALREEGIAAVAVAIDAISRGCSIESLAMSGNIQAREDPCRFYDAFGASPEVGGNEPPECRDGSGDHARDNHVMVWTGERALIWGGHRGGYFEYPDVIRAGLEFDPQRERWSTVPEAPFLNFLPSTGVWTGTELIVTGDTANRKIRTIAAAYNPIRSSWRWISFPYRKWTDFEAVWTGRSVLLWGGPSHTRDLRLRGALYDPASDRWRETAAAPIAGRDSHVAVWTGTEMIVWGGSNWRSDLGDGAAYNPATDSWRTIAPAPISPRQWLPAVWTGTEMILWGGSSYSRPRRDGAAYNPLTDTWRMLPRSPIEGRHYHSATWTGTEMIVFGGYDYHELFENGAAYDSLTNSWRRIARAPLMARFGHTAVWDGRHVFVFGGNQGFGHMALGDGALYDPARDQWVVRVIPSI